MTKRMDRIITGLFGLFIGGFFVMNLLAPDRDFSEKENRSLQTLPRFSLSSLFDGSFASRFESYCSDQFVGRDGWIEMKASAELTQGKQQNNGVFLCEGDRLIEPYTAPAAERIARAVTAFDSLKETGVPISLALIPTAAQLYASALPDGAPNDDQRAVIESAYAQTTLTTVDLLSVLSQHADEEIFYRTDHHWTSLGAFYAANALRSAWGIPEISAGTLVPETISEDFCGTLYSSSGFFWVQPDCMETLIEAPEGAHVVRYETNGTEQTLPIYNYDKLTIKDKYTFFLGGNIPHAVVKTGTENAPSLLILRDSYTDSLVPFLLDAFSEIHLIDLRYYTGSVREYITGEGIDRVLLLYGTENFCTDDSMRIY